MGSGSFFFHELCPFGGKLRIGDAPAAAIDHGRMTRSLKMASLGSLHPPLGSLRIALLNTFTIGVHQGNCVLCGDISQFGGFQSVAESESRVTRHQLASDQILTQQVRSAGTKEIDRRWGGAVLRRRGTGFVVFAIPSRFCGNIIEPYLPSAFRCLSLRSAEIPSKILIANGSKRVRGHRAQFLIL